MDKGIYTALSGGIAKSHELELIANNLANANTPGFKRDTGTFNEYLSELRRNDGVEGVAREIENAVGTNGRPAGDKSFVEMDGIYTDYRQGGVQRTGRDLDVAAQGKGFFEVLTPAGVRYTRAGNFNVSRQGELVNAEGYQVLARDPKLSQPGSSLQDTTRPEQRIIRLEPGAVTFTPDGEVLQGGAPVPSNFDVIAY